MKIVGLDFETANGNSASICAIGMATMEDGAIEETFYSLVKPHKEVSYFAHSNQMIHGISKKDVEDAPSWKDIYPEVLKDLDDAVVVAHNARFDMACLRECCKLYHLEIPDITYVDSVAMSRKAFPNLEHHRLNDVCEYLNIDLEHHNALSDAYGCLMIVGQIMNLANVYDIEDLCGVLGVNMHHLR